jgi:hypothetical protein
MFIIFGSPRSGTTLLKETLNLNPEIFIPHETSFIVPTAYVIDRVNSPTLGKDIIRRLVLSSADYPHTLGPYLGENDVKLILDSAPYTLAGVLRAIYLELGHRVKKKICGDKSPNDLMAVQLFQNLGLFNTEIKFIHLVRDVRGVMSSLLRVGWAPQGVERQFPRLWNYSNLHLYDEMLGKDNYLLLRYEDLVGNPIRAIGSVSHFLGITFAVEMLNETDRGASLRHLPDHANLSRPYFGSRSNAWINELPRSVRKTCEISAAEGLRTFGYVESGEVRVE